MTTLYPHTVSADQFYEIVKFYYSEVTFIRFREITRAVTELPWLNSTLLFTLSSSWKSVETISVKKLIAHVPVDSQNGLCKHLYIISHYFCEPMGQRVCEKETFKRLRTNKNQTLKTKCYVRDVNFWNKDLFDCATCANLFPLSNNPNKNQFDMNCSLKNRAGFKLKKCNFRCKNRSQRLVFVGMY